MILLLYLIKKLVFLIIIYDIKNMGNKNNRNGSILPTFNPKDEINTEENKLNLNLAYKIT